MKKKSFIIVLSIVLLIVLFGGGFAFAYFFTDAFKSNKQLFSKYISQNKEILEIMQDDDMKIYQERQQNTSYTTAGSIKTNVTLPTDSSQELAKALQNCNISFSGNTDKINKYFYQSIKANYSDAQAIEFEIAQNNDIYGIKINDVVTKYIGVENNNLKEFAKKMGIDENTAKDIPNKIEFAKVLSSQSITSLFTDEELSQLKDKYSQIVMSNITDDMYSKESTVNETAYVLTIPENKVKKIIGDVLTSVKDDDVILSKIRNYLSNSANIAQENLSQYVLQFQEGIQATIDQLNDNSSVQNTQISEYKIKTFVKNRKLVRTEIIIPNSEGKEYRFSIITSNDKVGFEFLENGKQNPIIVSMQKTKTSEELKYNFTASYENEQLFELSINYNGLTTQQVIENSELICNIDLNGLFTLNNLSENVSSQKTKFECKYNNTKTFAVAYTKTDITKDTLLINTAPNLESIQNLFKQVTARYEQVNAGKMKAAGIQSSQNPFVYYIPSLVQLAATSSISEMNNAFPVFGVLGITSVAVLSGTNEAANNIEIPSTDNVLEQAQEECTILANNTISSYYTQVYSGNNVNQTISADELDNKIIEAIKDNTKWTNNLVTRSIQGKTITLTYIVDGSSVEGTLNDGNITWKK